MTIFCSIIELMMRGMEYFPFAHRPLMVLLCIVFHQGYCLLYTVSVHGYLHSHIVNTPVLHKSLLIFFFVFIIIGVVVSSHLSLKRNFAIKY